MEYLSNQLLDHTNMSKPYFVNPLNEDYPPMEDKLKILKVEYLSNQLLDHSQILILSLDQIMFCQSFK